MNPEPYNDTVRRHFANPAHAGDLQAGYPRVVSADTSESEGGPRVLLAASIDGNMISRMCYRVFGCPHLIAAAEELCARFEGATVDVLQDVPMAQLMELLEVPVEKTGRLFLLEDAANALHKMCSGQLQEPFVGAGADRNRAPGSHGPAPAKGTIRRNRQSKD